MALWILQALIDVTLGGCALFYILQRKKLQQLIELLHEELSEARRASATLPLLPTPAEPAPAPASVPATSPGAGELVPFTPALPPVAAAPSGTLLERGLPERRVERNPSVDAYDKAERLLERRVDLREISRQTGLSLAELQLLTKLSNRTQ